MGFFNFFSREKKETLDKGLEKHNVDCSTAFHMP